MRFGRDFGEGEDDQGPEGQGQQRQGNAGASFNDAGFQNAFDNLSESQKAEAKKKFLKVIFGIQSPWHQRYGQLMAGGVGGFLLGCVVSCGGGQEQKQVAVAPTEASQSAEETTRENPKFAVFRDTMLAVSDKRTGAQALSAPVKYFDSIDPMNMRQTLSSFGDYGRVRGVSTQPLIIPGSEDLDNKRIVFIPEGLLQDRQIVPYLAEGIAQVQTDTSEAAIAGNTRSIAYRFNFVQAKPGTLGFGASPAKIEVVRDIGMDKAATEGDDKDMAVVYTHEFN